jgi:hypothetical protein
MSASLVAVEATSTSGVPAWVFVSIVLVVVAFCVFVFRDWRRDRADYYRAMEDMGLSRAQVRARNRDMARFE